MFRFSTNSPNIFTQNKHDNELALKKNSGYKAKHLLINPGMMH